DSPVEVLVVQSVLIVPDSRRWISHLVAHEPDAVVTRVRFDLVYRGACPCDDGRLCSRRRANRRKCEVGRAAAYAELMVRDVVEHIAFARMRLTPRVFVRSDILRLGEIARTGILRWVQVARRHRDPMRRASVTVPGMVVCGRWVSAGKWVHPGARTQSGLTRI